MTIFIFCPFSDVFCEVNNLKDINLIPQELKDNRMKKKRQIKNIFFGIIILFITSLLIILPEYYINKLNNDIKMLDANLNKFKKTSDLNMDIKNAEGYLKQKQNIIKEIESKRLDITGILSDVALNVPDRVSISNMKYGNNLLEISGESYSNTDVADFMLNLRSLKYVDDVKLLSVQASDNGLIKYVLHVTIKVVS